MESGLSVVDVFEVFDVVALLASCLLIWLHLQVLYLLVNQVAVLLFEAVLLGNIVSVRALLALDLLLAVYAQQLLFKSTLFFFHLALFRERLLASRSSVLRIFDLLLLFLNLSLKSLPLGFLGLGMRLAHPVHLLFFESLKPLYFCQLRLVLHELPLPIIFFLGDPHLRIVVLDCRLRLHRFLRSDGLDSLQPRLLLQLLGHAFLVTSPEDHEAALLHRRLPSILLAER